MKTILLILAALFITQPFTKAEPLIYTFSGTVTGFESDDPLITTNDFEIIIGETSVTYVFEVDFDRDTDDILNPIGRWSYFYSDLLSAPIINDGGLEQNNSYNVHYRNYPDKGVLRGGSTVSISAYADDDALWEVQDWYIGKEFNLIDEGDLQGAGEIRFLANVTLTAIEEIPKQAPPLSIISTINNIHELQWDTSKNKQYRIQCSADLRNWEEYKEPKFGTGQRIKLSLNPTESNALFFRSSEADEFIINPERFNYGKIGSKWTYQVQETTDNLTESYTEVIEVAGIATFNQQEAIQLTHKTNGIPNGVTYFANNPADGIEQLGFVDSEGETEIVSPSQTVVPANFLPENVMSYTINSSQIGHYSYDLSVYIETEASTIGTHTYPESIKTLSHISGYVQGLNYTVSTEEWYVFEIGMVKQVQTFSIPAAGVYDTLEKILTSFTN